MLTPELKKLKLYLEGNHINIDKTALLKELNELYDSNTKSFLESLSLSSNVCPTCGRKL